MDPGQHSLAKLDHIAASFGRVEASLDKITVANAEILDRLTRMEVQQSGQAAELHHQHEQMKEIVGRVSKVEIQLAVHGETTRGDKEKLEQANQHLLKRWGLIGAVALVVLGALGNALSAMVISYYQENRSIYEENSQYDRNSYDRSRDADYERLRESDGEP